MLGYSEAEMLGMTYVDVTHPDDRGLNTVNAESLLAGEVGHFSIEKRYVRKTGETVWVSLNAVAVAGENGGELLYSIGMAEDITARRQAESAPGVRPAAARHLVREVHHRIKNNLQSVAGLLQRELGKFAELQPAAGNGDQPGQCRSPSCMACRAPARTRPSACATAYEISARQCLTCRSAP